MAKKKTIAKTVYKRAAGMPDEEVAYRLVKMYFEDIARQSVKRKVDLDAVINAYFYALRRIENKEKELKAMQRVVEEEEKGMAEETKEELIPEPGKEEEKGEKEQGEEENSEKESGEEERSDKQDEEEEEDKEEPSEEEEEETEAAEKEEPSQKPRKEE